MLLAYSLSSNGNSTIWRMLFKYEMEQHSCELISKLFLFIENHELDFDVDILEEYRKQMHLVSP